jgi:hypothetical protein
VAGRAHLRGCGAGRSNFEAMAASLWQLRVYELLVREG